MNLDNRPPILAGPGWHASDLPVRNAVAVVVYDEGRSVLIVRRNLLLEEFPGAWSFPSVYEQVGTSLWESLVQVLQRELGLRVTGERLVFRRGGFRPRWRIVMDLFEADRASGPSLTGSKYDAIQWVDGAAYVNKQDESVMGDCMKAYKGYVCGLGGAGRTACR